METIILTVATVALVALRYLAIARPLYGLIPARWRWVPSAVTAAAAVLAEGLPGAADYTAAGGVVLSAIVALVLAAQAGAHADTPTQG